MLESKIVTTNSDVGSQWELPNEEGLPLPNEMLTKIFDYLDFQEISRCAQVSQQFNSISELTWKSWDKITIKDKEVSNEFLEFLLEKGIKELQILGCKMLPPVPKHKFTNPLKLKSVIIADVITNECTGYDGLISNVVKTHAMERIEFSISKFISNENFSEFIASLPQTGRQLRSLSLPDFEFDRESLDCIFESCVNLEELRLPYYSGSDPSLADYLSNNLTPSILKLDLYGFENYDDNALCKLVKRCSKLQMLDIGSTEVTWDGLSAIIDNLRYLECLAVPSKIGEELGLGNKIDMLKMEKLRSMKELKCLLIGEFEYDDENRKYQEMLVEEMPQLIRPEIEFLHHAEIKKFLYVSYPMDLMMGHKQVEFLSPTIQESE